MNTENCSYGFATDQFFLFDNVGTCDTSIALFATAAVLLTLLKGLLAVFHVRAWRKRQRRLYAKINKRNHYPIVPTLSVAGFIHHIILFSLGGANIINANNGWSYGVLSVGWLVFGLTSLLFFLKLVRLGRKLLPIVQEKKRLEQQQRDDDDPPTWNSQRNVTTGSFTTPFSSNPMYEDDPPTYDEATSVIPITTTAVAVRVGAMGRLGRGVSNGRNMIAKRVQSGRYIFHKKLVTKQSKKAIVSDPPKNPMWEEDPPTTYSIMDIVEPSIDKLKKLDLLGQLYFMNEILCILGQFITAFFLMTIFRPGDRSLASICLGIQAGFLFQHSLSMHWQFTRAIHAVRQARRTSRRNENIENGLKKMRGQQITIFLLCSIAGTIEILLATGTIVARWYIFYFIMLFEVLANSVILLTLSTKLRSKIKELRKNYRAGPDALNKLKTAGGAGNNNGIAKPGTPKKDHHLQSVIDDSGENGGKQMIVKSSVAHVRESAKFVTNDHTGSSSKKNDKEEKDVKSINW